MRQKPKSSTVQDLSTTEAPSPLAISSTLQHTISKSSSRVLFNLNKLGCSPNQLRELLQNSGLSSEETLKLDTLMDDANGHVEFKRDSKSLADLITTPLRIYLCVYSKVLTKHLEKELGRSI